MFVGTIEHKCSYIAKKSIASVSRDAIKTFGELLSIHGGFFWLHKGSPPEEIKKAYYNCMKACHPDLSGNDPETTNFCMFINEVYAVLSDPVQRMIYDEIHGYALNAINPFLDDSCLKDLAFVDEFSYIGICKNCANVAPDVFSIEEDFGRARNCLALTDFFCLFSPVDCIHWTSAPQLSLLEDEMCRVERVNVAMMLSGMNISAVDVFRMVYTGWKCSSCSGWNCVGIYFWLLVASCLLFSLYSCNFVVYKSLFLRKKGKNKQQIFYFNNRKVCVLCNLKPANMRGIKSQAIVLAASNNDHTMVSN
ncbi:hypothetical protein UlMin_041455 [Ulmus minor]